MSHELRTPLNAVLGFSEVLLERMFGDINERQEEYLRDIHGSGQAPAGAAQRDPRPVEGRGRSDGAGVLDVRAALAAGGRGVDAARAGRRARHRPARRGRARTSGPCTPTSCGSSRSSLNLMTNAVKFTGDGGSVVVRAAEAGAEIDITVDRHRHRRPGGGPGADLRVVPAGRAGQLPRGGHRPRAHPVAAHRRAARRPDVAGERGRRRQHVRLLPARPGPRGRGAGDDDRGDAGGRRRRRHRGRPAVAGPADGVPLRAPRSTVTTARDGQSGLDAVRRVRPDAVLLDIRLPGHRRVGGAPGAQGRARRRATSR